MLDRTLGDKRHLVNIELTVHPWTESGTSCDITFEEEVKAQLPADVREAVENGVHSAYLQGNRTACLCFTGTEDLKSLCPDHCQKVQKPHCSPYHFFPCAGPLMGFPVQGVQTVIQHASLESGTSAAMVSACVSRCMLKVSTNSPVSIS